MEPRAGGGADALLAGAERAEVLRRARRVGRVELDHDPPRLRLPADRYLQEHPRVPRRRRRHLARSPGSEKTKVRIDLIGGAVK